MTTNLEVIKAFVKGNSLVTDNLRTNGTTLESFKTEIARRVHGIPVVAMVNSGVPSPQIDHFYLLWNYLKNESIPYVLVSPEKNPFHTGYGEYGYFRIPDNGKLSKDISFLLSFKTQVEKYLGKVAYLPDGYSSPSNLLKQVDKLLGEQGLNSSSSSQLPLIPKPKRIETFRDLLDLGYEVIFNEVNFKMVMRQIASYGNFRFGAVLWENGKIKNIYTTYDRKNVSLDSKVDKYL